MKAMRDKVEVRRSKIEAKRPNMEARGAKMEATRPKIEARRPNMEARSCQNEGPDGDPEKKCKNSSSGACFGPSEGRKWDQKEGQKRRKNDTEK